MLMYVCPFCSREYNDSDSVVKHYLKCWKEHNPHQKSKSALHSQDVTTREVNEDVMNLFSLFQKR